MTPAYTKPGRVYVRPELRNRPVVILNGYKYRAAAKEPCVGWRQSLCAGLAIAAFVVGGVLVMGGIG